MAQHGEASVEEILESIKKVIARDNRDAALQAPAPRSPAQEVEPDDGDSDILDLTSMEFAQDAVHHAEDEEDEADPPLTPASVRQSVRENFAALAMLAEPGARPQIVRSGATSLEGLVREMLRPMLAEWLDKNLPGMVEKMVQAEIARIAGKRR